MTTVFAEHAEHARCCRTVSLTGFGDVVPGFKWNVFGNNWNAFSAAVKVGVKIPTASPGLGNGAVEYYIAAPVQAALPAGFSLGFQEEVDILKNRKIPANTPVC